MGDSSFKPKAEKEIYDKQDDQPTLLKEDNHHDVDENLFLRFLELDPTADSGTNLAQGAQRPISLKNTTGRTPFTITKVINRSEGKGFGFSIIWTHPPRIEKVEKGQCADKHGLLPGDYVIFVDKYNIVTMPESDIMKLIKLQGNNLMLEIYRKPLSPIHSVFGACLENNSSQRTRENNKNHSKNVDETNVENVLPKTKLSETTSCNSVDKLNLSQVKFKIRGKESIPSQCRQLILQIIINEQDFVNNINFGIQRFVEPMLERPDLLTQNEQKILFQNINELKKLSEEILDQLILDDINPQMNFTSRLYLSKTTQICTAYKKYCNGIKRAECILVNKLHNREFVSFINEPPIPHKQPDLTMFIHRPLQHFREIIKRMQFLSSYCEVNSEEYNNFSSVIDELQTAYYSVSVEGGLMGPLGKGRPLLTLQDLESRIVFTCCKPFRLVVKNRQWIFGGDLTRIEGRSVKQYWALLFTDIILFAKVSRDRVLFITEQPIELVNIVDTSFNIRKKVLEFRLTIDPNGQLAESPTGYCGPNLTKSKKQDARRKFMILRAPSLELKAVWQNFLQRQIFLVNTFMGPSNNSSPLLTPDHYNDIIPSKSFVGVATANNSSNLKYSNIFHQANQQKFDRLIDDKCRILNKNGTAKESALHLANWMKGQCEKQQEQTRFGETLLKDEESILYTDDSVEECITYWSRAQLEKRTQELNLNKEYNNIIPLHPNFGGKRLSGVEEVCISDVNSDRKSDIPDNKVTVQSRTITLNNMDTPVYDHCYTNGPDKSSTCNTTECVTSLRNTIHCCRLNEFTRNDRQSEDNIISNQGSSGVFYTHLDNQKAIMTDLCTQSSKSFHTHPSSMLPSCNKIIAKLLDPKQKVNNSVTSNLNKHTGNKPVSAINAEISSCNLLCTNKESIFHSNIGSIHLRKDFKALNNCMCSEYQDFHVREKYCMRANEWNNCKNCENEKIIPISTVQLTTVEKVSNVDVFIPRDLTNTATHLWNSLHANNLFAKTSSLKNIKDNSENSSIDEILPLPTTLRRFGTVPSLENLPSDESECEENYETVDQHEIETEIYKSNQCDTRQTNGDFISGTIRLIDESKAFLDKCVPIWNQDVILSTEEDQIEDCTSGATSGEEVWGTPTSGDDNDELNLRTLDRTPSSPTKSTTSYNDEDDSDLIMDELLMAPPMTINTVRGLLPRRRLEPLFEEETESDEEKTESDCEHLKQNVIVKIVKLDFM